MFKFLREKIENWAKNLTKKAEESEEKPKEKKKIKKVIKIKLEPEVKETKKEEKSFFQKIGEKINKIKISEKEFGVYEEELEMLLLENNVALEVAEKIVQDLKEKIIEKEFLKKEVESEIKEIFKEIIREILVTPPNLAEQIKEKNADQSKEPYVILFCGINGSGKTTTIAKIAEHLKSKKISCVIAAADTFRAASIEQIKEHGEKIGVKVISHEYGSDPASVGFDAINYAKKNFINCVLIDTAGRMHTQKNLLKEMEKIVKVCKPDKKIFVGESITGNDAIEQIRSFDWAVGIDGIVLTKADIDEKGGTALSVGYVTKKPILYLGTGQAYDKIEPFNKEQFIERLGL
jgi:fused signal recognition particle receptor